jgi:hypothetical protein
MRYGARIAAHPPTKKPSCVQLAEKSTPDSEYPRRQIRWAKPPVSRFKDSSQQQCLLQERMRQEGAMKKLVKCLFCARQWWGHVGDGEICEQCRLADYPDSIGG